MKNTCQFLFLMDAYETLNLQTETSLLIMQELLTRNHQVYWLERSAMYLAQGDPRGVIQSVQSVEPFVLGQENDLSMNDFDAVLMRFDPPFDSNYLHATYILDHLNPSIFQFNSVSSLRNFNEKILPMRWPQLTPPTLVSMNRNVLMNFAQQHEDVIVKPLDDCSGRGVKKLSYQALKRDSVALTQSLLDENQQARYIVMQKFLPAVKDGDKRIYLIAGDIAGAVNRIPQQGKYLANIHQGAACEKTTVSNKEYQAVQTIRPFLIEQGLFLVGVDFIDGLITEINITSPSAVRQINQVMGEKIHTKIVDEMFSAMASRCSCGIRSAA